MKEAKMEMRGEKGGGGHLGSGREGEVERNRKV